MTTQMTELKELVDKSQKILVIQADNPDADSLSSALSLWHILEDQGKQVYLYCALAVPTNLRYLEGWEHVLNELPSSFDMSIIVDTSANSLLEQLNASPGKSWVASKPCIVIDHHAGVECDIPYATLVINEAGHVSTGDTIYTISKANKWPLSVRALELIASSILADSLGLTTMNTSANTYRTMADIIDGGVSRPKLEEIRRAYNKMPQSIFRFKAKLIDRTSFHADGRIATAVTTQDEINTHSPLYNPNALIHSEHLMTEGVLISIAIKQYDNGRVTASIRCAYGAPYAAKIASQIGGNGHAYAAGIKVENSDADKIKNEMIKLGTALLDEGTENAAV